MSAGLSNLLNSFTFEVVPRLILSLFRRFFEGVHPGGNFSPVLPAGGWVGAGEGWEEAKAPQVNTRGPELSTYGPGHTTRLKGHHSGQG